MRIWRFTINFMKKDHLGRPMHPWEAVTLDQLTPEAAVKYAGELAAFEARNAREDAAMEMQQHLATLPYL